MKRKSLWRMNRRANRDQNVYIMEIFHIEISQYGMFNSNSH